VTTEKILKLTYKNIPISTQNVYSIREEIIYWRKANAIHAWFVKNVQKGNDDCGDYYVPSETLNLLYETVCKILKEPKKNRNKVAVELLPPQEGFFFGSTEIDEYYYEDLTHTKTELEKLFAEEDWQKRDYYYHSSW